MPGSARPRILIDAGVLIAALASPQEDSASMVILRMAEITLIEAFVPQQVLVESERNLAALLPRALPALHLIVTRCLRCVADPTAAERSAADGLADLKDAPILATAVREQCPWLVTFNVRHYQPGHPAVRVVQPGVLVGQVRDALAALDRSRTAAPGAVSPLDVAGITPHVQVSQEDILRSISERRQPDE